MAGSSDKPSAGSVENLSEGHEAMGEERRRGSRVELPLVIRYRPSQSLLGIWYTGTLLDLSVGGMRFSGGQPIEVGLKVDFQITLPQQKNPYFLAGEVVWDRQSDERVPEYGVSFGELSLTQCQEIEGLVNFLQKRPPTPPRAT